MLPNVIDLCLSAQRIKTVGILFPRKAQTVRSLADEDLTILECGMKANGCMNYVMSMFLTGSVDLYALTRRLATAALPALTVEITKNAYGPVEKDWKRIYLDTVTTECEGELEILRRWGEGSGILSLLAVAEAIGFHVDYSIHRKPKEDLRAVDWLSYSPSKDNFDGRKVYVWHTGGWHFQLGMEAGWKPLWDGKDRLDILDELTLLIDRLEENARNSTRTQARAMVAANDACWENCDAKAAPMVEAYAAAIGLS